MAGSAAWRALQFAWAGVPFLIFFSIWEAIPRLGLIDPTFLPSVSLVAEALYDLARGSGFYKDVGITVLRALCGLTLGTILGVTIGTSMAVSKGAEGFFHPLVKATYSLPKTSLIPLLILWFGIGTVTSTIAVMLSTLLPMIIYTYHGVQGAPRLLIWSALGMGTSRSQMLTRVLLPSALHSILTAFRMALGFSFVIAVAAEMIASNAGVGRLIFMYGENGIYPYLFAAVSGVVVVAFLIDSVIAAVTRYLLRWQEVQ